MDKKIMMIGVVIVVVAVVAVAAVCLTNNNSDNGGDKKDTTMNKLSVTTSGIVNDECMQVSVAVKGSGYSETLGSLYACNSGYAPKDAVITLSCSTCENITKKSDSQLVYQFASSYLSVGIDITGATVNSVNVTGNEKVAISITPTSDQVVKLTLSKYRSICDLTLSAPTGFYFQLVSSTDGGDMTVVNERLTSDDLFVIKPNTSYYLRLTTDLGYKFDAMQKGSVTYNDGNSRHSLTITSSGNSISNAIIYGDNLVGYGTYTDFQIYITSCYYDDSSVTLTISA